MSASQTTEEAFVGIPVPGRSRRDGRRGSGRREAAPALPGPAGGHDPCQAVANGAACRLPPDDAGSAAVPIAPTAFPSRRPSGLALQSRPSQAWQRSGIAGAFATSYVR